jgi:hypothetical protein
MNTGRDSVKKSLIIVLVVLALCSFGFGHVAANEPIGDITSPTYVLEPVTETPTAPPTTEPTIIPTTTPTTEPTSEPTTEITITIEPTMGGGKGWIDVNCNEDRATVYFDGKLQGVIAGGILSVAVSPTGTPVQTVSVSKAGYTTWSEPLSHMPADKEHVAVYATLNPQPTTTITIPPVQKGAIYAQSNPAGAAIYMNGILQGYSPITIPNLPPGTYSMKASLSGYTPDTQLIDVSTGQTAPYYPNLQQSPPAPRSTGTVSVTSAPNAALVYVDGNYQGKAPLTITLYPGSHSFRLNLPGYNDYTTSVYVTANTNQKLNTVLNTAIFGTVAISSIPGSSVWMDSNSQGRIPSSGILTLSGITSGNHIFRVAASGYNDWMNTVYIQPNVVNPVTAAMTPVGVIPTPATATGGFNIVSTPSGAEVYIDNLFRGYTPSTPDGIAAGQHQILLKYTGYVDYSATETVNPGQITPLAISLQPAPTPTPVSAPSLAIPVTGLLVILGISISLRRRSYHD